MTTRPWVTDQNAALFTDLYELTMLQAYVLEGMRDTAVFSLFSRRLPEERNYLLAAGLDDALHYMSTVAFSEEALDFLDRRDEFQSEFIDYLADFEFTGDAYAVPEGTPVFANEPIIEVEAPLPEAQLLETMLLNQINFQTILASKASRVVRAAEGRAVVDFGMRRMHGTDAAMKAARAFHIGGTAATSNVLAGQVYDVPVTGTMAHSYIQSHDDELSAFRAFAELYPQTVLLVDTYDTLEGIRRVVQLADQMGDDFRVRAIRLDSGDLADLAHRSREILDEGGLEDVEIFASGGLDEYEIAELVENRAPITGFGVGTRMGVSADAPSLDTAYKLVSYAGTGRMKLSSKKATLPGRKQIFRRYDDEDRAQADVIGLHDESIAGEPLLEPVMKNGERLPAGDRSLEESRQHARKTLDRFPERILSIEPAEPPYPVRISEALKDHRDAVQERTKEVAA